MCHPHAPGDQILDNRFAIRRVARVFWRCANDLPWGRRALAHCVGKVGEHNRHLAKCSASCRRREAARGAIPAAHNPVIDFQHPLFACHAHAPGNKAPSPSNARHDRFRFGEWRVWWLGSWTRQRFTQVLIDAPPGSKPNAEARCAGCDATERTRHY